MSYGFDLHYDRFKGDEVHMLFCHFRYVFMEYSSFFRASNDLLVAFCASNDFSAPFCCSFERNANEANTRVV